MDTIRTADATLYLYWKIEGIAERLVPVGTTSAPMGGTIKKVVESRSIAAMYPRVEPWKGIGSSGSIKLDLVDEGGYIAGLVDPGTEGELREDFDIGTLATIKLVDATNFSTSGTAHIHRRAYTWSGKSTNDLTGAVEVNNHIGTYEIKHEIGNYLGYEKDDYAASVRVGTTPAFLEGRYISMHRIYLDPGGYPITDDDGESDKEIWRGIITSFPPSPNGRDYTLQAETLERMIQEDPPNEGIAGSLLTTLSQAAGNNNNPGKWQAGEEPLFIATDRRWMRFSISCTSADNVLDEVAVAVDILEGGEAKWMTILEIFGVAAQGLLDAVFDQQGAGDVVLLPSYHVEPPSSSNPDPVFQFRFALVFDNWQYANGNVTIEIVHGPRSFWHQLGFLVEKNDTFAVTNGGSEGSDSFKAELLPASIYIIPSTKEIPVILNAGVAPAKGFVEKGNEILYYGDTSATQYVSGKPCTILRDCYRGYAGTLPEEHIYRFGGEDPPPVDVAAVYCIGGDDEVGGIDPDPSIWVSLMKVLTGTNGEYTNGDWDGFPGLGIPNEHVDVDAIELLVTKAAVAGPMIGRLETLRSFLSDALGLEGYALVTRPLSDGTCRLSPVRIGAVSAGETAVALDIDASRGVTIQGGLGEIINRVDVEGQRSTAKFRDIDSIAMFGVRQALSFKLPVSDPAGTLQYAGTVRRIFALAAGRNYYLADLSVSPEGRMIAPGDVVALTFANADLSGDWRVLHGDTRLRGDGSVRVRAMRVPGWVNTLLAPTAEIDSISDPDITLTAQDTKWFKAGATLWIYDPDEYSDGYEKTISAIVDGDTLTLNNVTDLAAGDLVEYNDETDKGTEDRYAWLTSPAEYNWGD